jgi:beta-lactam-binding protein with PASTA domain
VKQFLLGGLAGAVLVGLILVLVFLLADLQVTNEDVKVPSLLGDRANVAKAKVEALGLKTRVVGSVPSSDPLGLFAPAIPHVTRQIPEGGDQVGSGGTVTIFVG